MYGLGAKMYVRQLSLHLRFPKGHLRLRKRFYATSIVRRNTVSHKCRYRIRATRHIKVHHFRLEKVGPPTRVCVPRLTQVDGLPVLVKRIMIHKDAPGEWALPFDIGVSLD